MDTFLRWSHKENALPTNTTTLSQQKKISTDDNFEFCYFDITKVVSTYFVRRQSHYDLVWFKLRRIFDMLLILMQHPFS